MKKYLLLAAFLAAVSSSFASPVEQTIRQIEQDWAVALTKADVAAIDKIEAADYQATDFTGMVSNKAQGLADLKSGAAKIDSFVLGELKVRVYGDTAVVNGTDTEKSSYKGKDTSGQYSWTDVFVKQGGAWKAVNTQVTKVVKD